MTTRPHGENESPSGGLEGLLEDGFAWIQANARVLAIVAGSLFVAGVVGAFVYESRRATADEAYEQLATIERQFALDMGADPGAATVPEPANADAARKARETAIAAFDALITTSPDGVPATQAALRAATLEVDLAEYAKAEARMGALAAALAAEDPTRGIALRLQGYALEQQARYSDAGAAYLAAAEIQTLPTRALAYDSAGRAFERAGANDSAIQAFQGAVAADPEFAEGVGLLERIDRLAN